MYIEITDLEGNHVIDIPATPYNLGDKIEEAKNKYPKGQYHATLVNY